MSKNKLYVRNLGNLDDDDLLSLFEPYGEIVSYEVFKYPSGHSKGYGFVLFLHEKNAENAKSQMNGHLVNSKPLQVSYFQEKEEKTNKDSASSTNLSSFLTQPCMNKLFVTNLDERINSYELEKLFEKYGTITFCRVMEKNGKSKGCGIVGFSSEEEAKNSISFMNGRTFYSKQMKVDFYKAKGEQKYDSSQKNPFGSQINLESLSLSVPKTKPSCSKIHVKNLHEDAGDSDLNNLFEQIGSITSFYVLRDNYGRSKGSGVIKFSNEEEASNAIRKMNGFIFMKKKLCVEFFECKNKNKKQPIPDLRMKNPFGFQLSMESQSLSNSKKVFVKNLHEDACDSDLNYLFEQFRPIKCYVLKERNGRSKRSGVVEFSNEENAFDAIRLMNNFEYMSKELCVEPCKSKNESKKDSISDPGIKDPYGSQSSLDSQSSINSKTQSLPLKIYVKSLHEDAQDSDLNNLFAEFRPIKCYVLKERNGRSKQSGIVEFSNEEDTLNAIRKMNGFMYMSKQLCVEFGKSKSEAKDSIPDSRNKAKPSQKSGSSLDLSTRPVQKLKSSKKSRKNEKLFKLRVENLDDDVNNDGLRRLFSPFGKIISAKVMTYNNGNSQGYGFVSYETNEEASKAISSMNGVQLSSKKSLVVAYSEQKEKLNNVDGNKNEVERECCVCYGDLSTRIAFIPCGHTSVCDGCVTLLNNKCPICQRDFITFTKVYI